MLTRKTESRHEIIIALAAYDHGWASCSIEDLAQFIIRRTAGHDDFPRYTMVELSEHLMIHRCVLSQ